MAEKGKPTRDKKPDPAIKKEAVKAKKKAKKAKKDS
jgi:hypothetical protein